MKRKSILLASALFGSIAVVSTGFAAWVITSPTATTEAEGNVKVETVQDKRVAITPTWEGGNSSIIFGKDDGSYANTWLDVEGDTVGDENLSVTLNVAVTNAAANSKIIASVKVFDGETDITAQWESKNKWVKTEDDPATDGVNEEEAYTFITLPTGGQYTISEGQVTIPLVFNWGTIFDNKNPAEYYNLPYSDALATEALARLQAFYDFTDSLSFKVVLQYQEVNG